MGVGIHDRVEHVPRGDVLPYTNNPKEHPDEQVEKIASSIKNYGWDQPIVVDEGCEIIKGHGRLLAAEKLGLDEVPVIRRDDLTDAEKRAARIADNKVAESDWLTDELAIEFEQLDDAGYDTDKTGFDADERTDIFDEVTPPEITDFEPEEFNDDDMSQSVLITCATKADASYVSEWADSEGFEWHVVDEF